MVKVTPSILSANYTTLGETIKRLEQAKADMIHIDVMDGSFVDTISFGAKMVADIKSMTTLDLDVHLMIVNPKKHIKSFADARANIITVHVECTNNLEALLMDIKDKGIKCGVSIKPDTQVDTIASILNIVDMVLVMTVEPGKGGQKLIDATLDKVAKLKQIKDENGYTYDIQVDGGINIDTFSKAVSAGANVLVAGSAITNSSDYAQTISILKGEK